MKKLLFLITMLFASSVFALNLAPENVNTNTNANSQGQNQGQGQGQLQAQGQLQGQGQTQGINSRIDNDVRNNAAAFAGAASKSESDSHAKSSSNSGGNTQSITVTDSGQMHYSGGYDVKNVPNIVSGNIYPTSPCMGGTSVGGAGVGFGFSFGTSWTDDECGIRETARSFSGMGMKDDAIKVLCSSKYAAVAPACMAK